MALWSVWFSNYKILRLVDFQALHPKFVLALEPKVFQLEGSSFGNRPSIHVQKGRYMKTTKSTHNSDLGVEAFLPLSLFAGYPLAIKNLFDGSPQENKNLFAGSP